MRFSKVFIALLSQDRTSFRGELSIRQIRVLFFPHTVASSPNIMTLVMRVARANKTNIYVSNIHKSIAFIW